MIRGMSTLSTCKMRPVRVVQPGKKGTNVVCRQHGSRKCTTSAERTCDERTELRQIGAPAMYSSSQPGMFLPCPALLAYTPSMYAKQTCWGTVHTQEGVCQSAKGTPASILGKPPAGAAGEGKRHSSWTVLPLCTEQSPPGRGRRAGRGSCNPRSPRLNQPLQGRSPCRLFSCYMITTLLNVMLHRAEACLVNVDHKAVHVANPER